MNSVQFSAPPNLSRSIRCEECFEELVPPYLKLGTKLYHQECFVCCECKEGFSNLQFLYVLNKNLHKDCFKCKRCNEPFRDSKFVLLKGDIIHGFCK